MRLDRFLSVTGTASRANAAKLIRQGAVLVNGTVMKKPDSHIDPDADKISVLGKVIPYKKYVYIMLNKPEGYISATEDGKLPTVLELIDEKYRRMDVFPCGRLDRDTVGLLLITNDGDTAHRLLSPKNHVKKTYRFKCESSLDGADIEMLQSGVTIRCTDGSEYKTKSALIVADDDMLGGEITITEGKFHQIKKMFEAVGNKITYLERISFGSLVLDRKLQRGEWRLLTEIEEADLIG